MDKSNDGVQSGNSAATDAAAAGDDGSALTDNAGKSSSDPMARLEARWRAINEGDRTAYAEAIEVSGRHPTQQELNDFDGRGGAPLLEAMRQQALLGGEVHADGKLGQRWEQFQKDLVAMDDGDRAAYIRASEAIGVSPSAEDLAGFDLRGGPPVFEAGRRQQLWGTFNLEGKLGQRVDQAMQDIAKAQQGDVEAARRLEVQTGQPPGSFDDGGRNAWNDPGQAAGGGFDWFQPAPDVGTGSGPDVGTVPQPESPAGSKLSDVDDLDIGPGSDPDEWNAYPSNADSNLSPAPLEQAKPRVTRVTFTEDEVETFEAPSNGSGKAAIVTFMEDGGDVSVGSDGSVTETTGDGSTTEYPAGQVAPPKDPTASEPQTSTDSDTNSNEGTTDDDDAENDEDPEDEDEDDPESEEGGAAARTGAADESESLPDRVGIGALQDSPSGYVDRLTDYGPAGAPQQGAGDAAGVRLPSREKIALYGEEDGAAGDAGSGFVDPLTDYGPGGMPRNDYGSGDIRFPSPGTDQDPRAAGGGLGSIARGDGSALTQASLETPGHGSLAGMAGANGTLDFESSTLFDFAHETAGLEVHHGSFATVADMSLDLDGPPEANGAGGLDWLDDD